MSCQKECKGALGNSSFVQKTWLFHVWVGFYTKHTLWKQPLQYRPNPKSLAWSFVLVQCLSKLKHSPNSNTALWESSVTTIKERSPKVCWCLWWKKLCFFLFFQRRTTTAFYQDMTQNWRGSKRKELEFRDQEAQRCIRELPQTSM